MIDCHSSEYDAELGKFHHYQAYPEMLPYVGRCYGTTGSPRILLIAESHYFPKDHPLPSARDWYAGTSKGLSSSARGHINTRELISCGKNQRWKRGGMRMFGNLESEIIAGGLPLTENSFVHVAFMNAFQRPARFQSSFRDVFEPQDGEVAAEAIAHTIKTIVPAFVCVASSYSWGVLNARIRHGGVAYETTAHALCAWWYRSAKGRPQNNLILRDFIRGAIARCAAELSA